MQDDKSQLNFAISQKEGASAYDSLLRDLQGDDASDEGAEDDFYNFIHLNPVITDCHPLQWWCKDDVRMKYSSLSRMTIDILSIPRTSAEPERTFSGARRPASWDRLRISCASIELVECIGNWLRTGISRQDLLGLRKVDIEGYKGYAADSDMEGMD